MKRVSLFIGMLVCVGSFFAQLNQTDTKGLKQGPWQKNYPGTAIAQYKGSFLNDKPVGKFIYNFENGQKKAEVVHGLPGGNSSVLLYYENGQILADGFYKGEKKDSLWYNYAITGELISAENYHLDELNGKCVYYFQEGQHIEQKLQIHKVVNYVNGKLEGSYLENFYNGRVKLKGTYVNGLKSGQWVEYYSTGEVLSKVNYQNDLPNGWVLIYDKLGQIKKRAMYRDGYELTEKEYKTYLERCKALNIDPNQ
jgi:antitoxin component YwqK of YwqJK toxin-antitoxin module